MKIGVSINGVLRDFFGQIEKTHTKYFNPEDGQEISVKDYHLENWISFPKENITRNEIEFNPHFNEKEFILSQTTSQDLEIVHEEEITVEDFIYDKCCLEIFGYANESIDGAVQCINDLNLQIMKKHEMYIISREAGRSVPATLFFLSKTACMVQNLKFVLGNEDCWEHVDCMITDHPEILESKPEGKITIKIDKPYNTDIPSDYTIRTVRELDGLSMFS